MADFVPFGVQTGVFLPIENASAKKVAARYRDPATKFLHYICRRGVLIKAGPGLVKAPRARSLKYAHGELPSILDRGASAYRTHKRSNRLGTSRANSEQISKRKWQSCSGT
jgi:hypothetical protein